MTLFGTIGFSAPWLLLGLLALPILWIILRAVPPAPIRRLFPGVILLFGLKDKEHETHRTPWWLLLLRVTAIGAIIVGFAGPILNPNTQVSGNGPLLILTDGTWADARDWPVRLTRIQDELTQASRKGRTVALVTLTNPPKGILPFVAASDAQFSLPDLQPHPWLPDPAALAELTAGLDGEFDTLWLSSGLDFAGKDELTSTLQTRGDLHVFATGTPLHTLGAASFGETGIEVPVQRLSSGGDETVTVTARGPDPNGNEAELGSVEVTLESGSTAATAIFDLPPELRNRVTRFDIPADPQAGAVSLADDSLKRREVALISGAAETEGLELLAPLHFLREALRPSADLIEGSITDMIAANPDAIVLADVAKLSPTETEALTTWVTKGGLLLRFAGPRLAASDLARDTEDPLMPVRLRTGGRSIGGAMSWGEPRKLQPFDANSPFHGLTIPEDVEISSQVLAQPGPELAERTIAMLADGTPLVTRKIIGTGQVILFHVTANAEWSNLPLSGLFVQMLERLAVTSRSERPSAEDLDGLVFTAKSQLDAFGRLRDAGSESGLAGEALAVATASKATPPGLYQGPDRLLALNAMAADQVLTPASWPVGVPIEGPGAPEEQPLKALLLALALCLLAFDVLATLALGGRLSRGWRAGLAALTVLILLPHPSPVQAQAAMSESESIAEAATSEVILAYVKTGNARVDEISAAGLLGLSDTLYARTSVEPGESMGVDPERDELAFFPFLYWPVLAGSDLPSSAAYDKLNRYLRSGGMIMFDLGDPATGGSQSDLQRLASGLDVPPLEPIPDDHVLTRAFYLLSTFPGREPNPQVWVEAAPPDAALAEGMPFRNLNDGVTPIIIGSGDWARAWAMSPTGAWLFPVGRGNAGERQREMALRFGVNVIMHVLTGNYKSDQVHVPALLERLGQ